MLIYYIVSYTIRANGVQKFHSTYIIITSSRLIISQELYSGVHNAKFRASSGPARILCDFLTGETTVRTCTLTRLKNYMCFCFIFLNISPNNHQEFIYNPC